MTKRYLLLRRRRSQTMALMEGRRGRRRSCPRSLLRSLGGEGHAAASPAGRTDRRCGCCWSCCWRRHPRFRRRRPRGGERWLCWDPPGASRTSSPREGSQVFQVRVFTSCFFVLGSIYWTDVGRWCARFAWPWLSSGCLSRTGRGLNLKRKKETRRQKLTTSNEKELY